MPVKDVVYRELKGEMVLVHLETGSIYALNETGARFWELLVSGRSRDEIRMELLDEFAVEPANVEEEMEALVAELSRAGLVA